MHDADGFDTPEQVALAGWPEAASARVVSVDQRGDQAEVVLDVNGIYRYWIYLAREQDSWVERTSGNGPNHGFRDAT